MSKLIIVVALFALAAVSATALGQVVVRHAGAPAKRAIFDVGDTIEVVVKADAPSAAKKVTARWTDSYGRLVAERAKEAGRAGETVLRFPVKAVVSTGNKVEVLVDGKPLGEPVAFGCSPQHTRPLRDWYTFPWAAYPVGTGDALRSVGCNGQRGYGTSRWREGSFDPIVANDLRYYVDELLKPIRMPRRVFTLYKKDRKLMGQHTKPFLAKWSGGVADHSTLARQSCLSDPETLKRMDDMAAQVVKWHAPMKPVWYNMQDEGGMGAQNQKNEFCYSRHCLAGFRKWIQTQYPSLKALNDAWGTAFSDFDAVEPMTSYEVRKRERDVAVAKKRLAPFCDHRAYMDIVMLKALARCRAVGRKHDPTGLFGMTGTQGPSPWPGFDYSQLAKVLDIGHYYNYNNAIEIARSFHARQGTRLFPYPGWFAGKKRCRYDWYYLFHGVATTGLWDIDKELLDKDGRPTEKGLGLKDTWLELQRGIGRLYINAKRDNDPIGFHFSQPSRRVQAMVYDDKACAGQTWSWDDSGAERALEDIGYQYEFVAYDEVEQGLLTEGGFKLYFVLAALAVSDAEAKAMTDWVAAGGVLVIDKWAGLFDEHGRGRAKPALAALIAGKADSTGEGFDVFAHGKGKVVRLKADARMARYPTRRHSGGEAVAPVKKLAGDLAALAGLKPRLPVLDEKGAHHHAVEVVMFTDGPARYAGVLFNTGYDGRLRMLKGDKSKLAKLDKPSTVKVVFDGKSEVYNIRTGKHLGKVKALAATLDPVYPLCYALLGYRVTGVTVNVPKAVKRGEAVIVEAAVKASAGKVARHVLRADVLGPDGKLRTYYSRNLETEAGKAEMTIPLALNDAVGAWKVRVKDTATGTTAEAAFDVK